MMMSTFIAHDSINLYAQCPGGGGGGGGQVKYRENHQKLNKKTKAYGAKSFTELVFFLYVCGIPPRSLLP